MIKLRVAGENYFHNRDSVFAWKADTAGRKDLFAAHTSYENTSLTRICDVCLTFDHWLKVIMDHPGGHETKIWTRRSDFYSCASTKFSVTVVIEI